MGTIPDWKPIYYNPDDVPVPFFITDTEASRQDLANMYTTISRLDQGIRNYTEINQLINSYYFSIQHLFVTRQG